jgi:hypothetical protein
VRRHIVIAGVVAGVLAGAGTVAAVTASPPDPAAVSTSMVVSFFSDGSASCTVEIRSIVHSADPAARSIVRGYLTHAARSEVEFFTLAAAVAAGDQGGVALAPGLSRGAEEEIRHRLGSRVDVTVLSVYSCDAAPAAGDAYVGTPPVTGDDFGREPTLVAGRPPDVVGFFRASTGQICEIQLKVDADRASGATEDDGAVAARAYLASLDFTRVDYSSALRDLAGFWPADHDDAEAEASALAQTLTRQAHSSFDTSDPSWLPIIVEGWTHCDPEPSG